MFLEASTVSATLASQEMEPSVKVRAHIDLLNLGR